MGRLWQRAQGSALLNQTTDDELAEYVQCFAAGYRRGIADVRGSVPRDEWASLTASISRRLVGERTPVEAGCWLAGMRAGRDDALAGRTATDERIWMWFCDCWRSGCIAEATIECDRASVTLTRILIALLLLRDVPRIDERLSVLITARHLL